MSDIEKATGRELGLDQVSSRIGTARVLARLLLVGQKGALTWEVESAIGLIDRLLGEAHEGIARLACEECGRWNYHLRTCSKRGDS